jgi:hypothetical protein
VSVTRPFGDFFPDEWRAMTASSFRKPHGIGLVLASARGRGLRAHARSLEEVWNEVFASTVRPILSASSSCVIRPIRRPRQGELTISALELTADDLVYVEEKLVEFARRRSGRTEVDLEQAGVRDDARLWWCLISGFTYPLLTVPCRSARNLHFLHVLGDPAILSTSQGYPESIQRSTRRAMQRSGQVGILLHRDIGAISANVYGKATITRALHDEMIEEVSDIFKAGSLTSVLPLEMCDPMLLLDLEETDRDPVAYMRRILDGALERPTDVERGIVALAVADLVSALAHHGPRDFSYHQRDVEKIETLIRRRFSRRKTLPIAELVAKAHEVVRTLAKRSPIPKRIWWTEGPRELWRRMMRDLEKRLLLAQRAVSRVP